MKFTDVAGIMNIPYVAEKVKLSHVAEIVKLSHVAGILEAGSMYDPHYVFSMFNFDFRRKKLSNVSFFHTSYRHPRVGTTKKLTQ